MILLARARARRRPVGRAAADRAGAAVPSRRRSHARARPSATLDLRRRPEETFRVHLELFADRRVVVVPSGIGVARGGCVYPARTLAPTGVVEVARGDEAAPRRPVPRSGAGGSARTRCSRSARPRPCARTSTASGSHGAPASIPLTPRAQIVLELGAYVPPHPRFLFPQRSAP